MHSAGRVADLVVEVVGLAVLVVWAAVCNVGQFGGIVVGFETVQTGWLQALGEGQDHQHPDKENK